MLARTGAACTRAGTRENWGRRSRISSSIAAIRPIPEITAQKRASNGKASEANGARSVTESICVSKRRSAESNRLLRWMISFVSFIVSSGFGLVTDYLGGSGERLQIWFLGFQEFPVTLFEW